jgi:prepilin-type N-terminal cleavage/methylation domain-containing protein
MNPVRKTSFFSNGVNYELRKRGFSLTEVLLAVGILAVGMLFIAGTFLVGIHFSIIATEQTIAAVTADEAFAKIKLYGVNLNSSLWQTPNPTIYCVDFNNVSSTRVNPSEFAYPSTSTVAEKQYYWSALCRRVEGNLVQVTVFVCRKVGSGTAFPVPVKVGVSGAAGNNVLTIQEPDKVNWINDGYTIADDQTGQIYRVVERHVDNPSTPIREDHIILLDRPWVGGGSVWVVPPAAGGGRYPCIAVYPTEIRF